MLQLKNVVKKYNTKAGVVNALDGVSLTFPSSGMVFVLGKSGSGKTTMLNVIGGLDDIDGGEILIQDKQFSTFTAKEYDSYRNTFIGFVFQEYNLLSEYTVEYNIKIAMELQGRPVDEEECNRLLREMEIENLKNRKPSELSGGQRQRVAIARALVKQPRIIMADEPTGALDSTTGTQVFDMLKKLSKEKLVIVVSHDEEFAEKYADRIIRLVDGKVVEDVSFTETEVTDNVRETENSLIVRDGSDLSESEKNAIAKAVKERKKIEIIEKIGFRDKRKTGEITLEEEEPVALKKSKMKWRSSAYLGVKSLGVKPIRLVLTVLLSALAFAVFGLFDTVANLNAARILKNHMSQSQSATLVAGADYIVQGEDEAFEKYTMKVSQGALDELAEQTRGAVKGVLGFRSDFGKRQITHANPISEIWTSNLVQGSEYYSKYVNGFVEFNRNTELNEDDTFKDFNYELVEGEYPAPVYVNGKPTGKPMDQVAISTYLADSMIFFLNGKELNGVTVEERGDLLGCIINVGTRKYTIVGLVDCGEIPERYDTLRDSMPSQIPAALKQDYKAYIDGGARKCLFVGAGFAAARCAEEGTSSIYRVSDYQLNDWSISGGVFNTRKLLAYYVYNVNECDDRNIVMFNGDRQLNGSVTLESNEILLDYNNFADMLEGRINALSDKEDRVKARAYIDGFSMGTVAVNIQNMEKLLALLNLYWSDGVDVSVDYSSSETDKEITGDWKIAGVYFGINRGDDTSGYKLMVSEEFMKTYHIYHQQGEYNKILFSEKSVKNGGDIIVDYLTSEGGLTLTWYNNPVLGVISKNEMIIRQIADLFLYVALALASISIFMLYNYISTSISSKRRSVGVLRALGAGGKDILRTFLIESLIIAIINGALACVFSAWGCVLVNSYVMNIMNIYVAFALFGVRQIIIIILVSFLTAFISSALPIIKISKKKPVELIRRS